MSLFWLSFVDPSHSNPPELQEPGTGGFLGVAIVTADSPEEAVTRAWHLQINPGGEVAIFGPAPDDACDPKYRDRLLTYAEAQIAGGDAEADLADLGHCPVPLDTGGYCLETLPCPTHGTATDG